MRTALLGLLGLSCPLVTLAQTGETCGTAIPLTLDGVCRSYTTSSTTDTAVYCTGYAGSSPVTYFSFTTNSTPDKVLVNITAPTAQPCEVALYSSLCSTKYSSGSMCFDDGSGLWSFGYNFNIQPNTTYKLRVKTTTAGSITVCARNYTPANNDCSGATSIGTTPLDDNNACNSPGSISPASLLCASTLENTAFYQFYVASDGNCVVNISGISCDNGNGNNSNGFQVGFFKGSCGTLEPLGCDSNINVGSNSFLQFTTPSLAAGTKVFVAIDGMQGANCAYNISGINIMGVLAEKLEQFNGWKLQQSNLLKWTILHEDGGNYVVERSADGTSFHAVGNVKALAPGRTGSDYSFEDRQPGKRSFYRIKKIGPSGKIAMSEVVMLERSDRPDFEIRIVNPVLNNNLDVTVFSESDRTLVYSVHSVSGQFVFRGAMKCSTGATRLSRDISGLPAGKYFISFATGDQQFSRSFVKMN